MSRFSRFMKANKTKKQNEKYAATKTLTDENGKPLEWEFRHITSKENEDMREACTIDVQVKGKMNMFRPKLNTSKYIAEMICRSVVYPDLLDSELQDSYGVKTPQELLFAMVDDPGEYQDLCVFVQKFQGFDETLDEKVEQAKN